MHHKPNTFVGFAHLLINTIGCWELIMGSIITTKKGLLKLVKGQIEVEVNGSNQPAKDGEQLPKGAVLHIGENATYEITFDDGTKLSNEVPPNATAAAPNTANEAALDEIQALQDLIASGEDPTQNLPETAAGNAPAGRDGNSGYVTLARDGTEALATSGYSTSGQTLTAATTATPEQTVATDSPSVLVNDSITVDEDTVASGNVLDNDSDADNVLSVVGFNINGTDFAAGTVVTLEGGSFILNADGSYTFTPNENWNGQVPVITYTTNTGSTATLTINVTPVDDPSVLANDTNTVAEDTVATGNVLDNDTDVDSSLSVVSFTVSGSTFAAGTTVALEGGSLVLNADGSYSFTPNENWNGQVPVITYTTNTGSTATLTINVTPVDDPSVLANDTNTVAEDTVATGNVLDNDTDVDSSLSVVSFTVSGSTFAAGTTVTLEGGSLVLNADGSYSFTPNADWNGQVPVITYTTNTGSTATLTINVTPVDDPSVLANDTNTVDEDTVATGNVLDNDTDVDSSLSVVSFTVSGSTFAAGTTVALEGGSLVLNADGSYSFTPNADWNGQVPVITYTTNTGSTATLTINVTPVADGAPSVTITTDTNDDGFISNAELGGATDVSVTIGLGGTGANAGDTLTVNGVDYVLTQEDINNGYVNLTLPAPAEGETITVVATITDPAGNTSPEGSDSALLDTTAPTITVSAPDDTRDTTPTITGTTDAAPGSVITIVVTDSNGVQQTLTTTVNPDGTYAVDVINPIPHGGYTATATVTDPAGNTGNATDNGNVDIKIDEDGDGNTVAITSITQDTGSSSSDFITNDNTLVFHGTVDLDDNSTLAVTINGVTYTTANGLVIDAQGNWSVDLTGTVLPDGTYPVVATVTDVAGNSKTVTQDVVIDTKIDEDGDGNTVAITSITQDTGSSSSDFITNDNTLVFHGTVDLDDNSTLAVTINGVTYTTANGLVIDAQGNWSVDLTGTVLPDGTYPVVATVTDIAGNTTSATQDVIVDTQIGLGRDNAVTITSITEDTGSSNTDFITNDNTLVFQGTVELDGNSNLVVTINGVEYTIGNGLVIDANGHWSVDLTGTVLPDGTYPVVATVTDVAGNSKTVTQDVVIDTKIDEDGDGNTVAITSITQDTGSSSSDFITNDNTLVFHGTVDLDDNSTLAVTINGVTYTTANGLVIDAQGNWSVDLTGTVLPDGTYPVVATVTDVAGNSKTVTQDVVIDTKIDEDGDGNTVAITSITQDTGSSSSDFITNDNTLVFHGTVDLDDNSTLAVTINGVTYTTANGLVIDAQGNWSVDLTGTVLPDGTYPVVATVTDLAGNSKTVTQDVVIDTKIDEDGDGNTVAITSITQDTGSSSSDFITNDNTLVFHGTVDLDDNSTLAVTINGNTYTVGNGLVIDAQGNWSVDLTGTVLADGTYTVNATVTDVAGNFKTVTQDVIIDTQGPSVVVNIVDDVLTVGETSEVTFTFSEKVTGFDASDLVVVGGTLSNLSSTDGINWTATFTPTPGFTGTASVTVTAGSYTDLNGNLGTSGSDTAGVDTQGPSVVVNIVDDVLTVGETSEVTFTFSEKVTGFDASDLVVVGGTLSNLSSTDGINWTATFTPTPGFTGTASVTVTAGSYTDLNGNLGTSGSDTAGVDTQGPSVVVNIVDDVLTVGETSEVTFTFSEKVTSFDASDLVVVGGTLSNLSSTDGINWTATFTPTPGFTGTASVTVTAGSYTDLNGNLGTSGSDTAGVDTQGPSVVVNIVDDVLTVGETSEVTFTFSEKVTGFDASDLVVVGGTLSNLSSTDGINWTATFTPTPGFTGTASVTVTAGSYTDLNGNLGTSGSDTAGVDTQGPSVVVNIVDDVLTVGETSEVTFTFSEKVTGFDASDLVVVGGTLSNLSSTDGINWTATFTPTPGFTGTASVTVTAGSYTDLNGNLGTSGSDTAGVDTQGPSVVVNIVDDVLTVGETSEVTFTFSEKVTGFDASDLVVVGGTLSNLSSTDGINWTATFTPTPGFTGTASVTVPAGSYTDLNGNLGTSGSDTAGVDTQGPSVVVNIVDDVLTVGETSEVTFTFSEKVTGFDASDLVVVGGTLSNLSSTDGINWTATFTPTPGFTGTASVTVTAGSYTDLNGNLGTSGSDTAGVDTQGPSVVVNIVDDVLTVGETSEVTFTFSEKVTSFDASDLVVVGGTLSNLSSTDGINWTATFTPTPGFTGTASVTVTAGSYTDLNGNLGTSGSDTAGVDTQGPSVVVNIVDDVLTVGETSEVTFTFSEKVTGFDASDLVVVGGTLSNLSSTDGINWTATFTPTPGFTGTASVTVTAGSYTDLNGNLGTSGSDTAGVDTQGPSVVVNIVDDVLTVGETSEVTFTFSEKVTGFDASDLVVVGGTLSNLSSTDGINWTATFTPTPGFTGTASVTVTAGSYTDLNGNLGTSGSDTAGVDTQGPSVVVNIVDDVLTVGETSEVTFTFSEKVTGFDASDLVVVGGTLSNLSSTDGINWTATFTPTPGFTGTASVTVTAGSYTDLNGNLGTSGSDTAGVDTQGPSVVVNIVDDVLTVGETSEVTFTFSEKVTGFDASDLVVVGGTLSNLSSTDGINWTATFTPTPGFTGTASVTVTAGSYTDLNGNLGTSGSDTAGVDTQGPSVVVNIVDDVLTVGETSEVTFTFSEKVTGFDASDLVVVGGTLSNLSSTDGINWTATFTPTPGFTGTASVTVTAGSYTDLNGNLGTSGSDTAGVDTQGPSVVVNIVDDVLTVGETSEVTFTFSEKVTGFDASDLVVVGGTLSNLSSTDGINWTATFTPTPGFTGTASVTVTAGSYTDLNGNLGTSGSDTAGVDTQGPSVVVNIVDDVLTVGETSEVTFTFSEKVTSFDASDLVVVGGTLSNLSSTDGINWTATFTPTPGFTGTASVTVPAGSYTDLNGNLGTSGSDTAGVDTQGPSVVVNIVDDVLTVGETSEVTFTFSEKVTGFDASDLVVVGGTLSNLSSTDGINWTATFTPTPGFTGTASVTVTAGSYTDLNGNLGTSGSDTAGEDTQGPSVVVNIVDDVLTVGETSEVTFTFSEKVTGFDASDLVVVGGTLSNLSSTDGINWTATFTPTPGFTGTASVTVTAGSYTDLNGNLGTSGSDTAGVDTQGPSVVVNIVDDVLTVGETSEVTFTFSEKVTGFDASDLVVVGGTLSNLSSTDGINWTATFTPTPGFTGTASVTVTAGSYTDLNGNLGTSGSDTAGVDTQGPSVVVNIVDDVLTVGETSEVTFTFSEKVTGFDASDLVVVGGTLSNLSSTDGINWTATFTPTPGFTGTASVTVTAGSYTDLNGNLGTSGSDTAGVDTQGPSVVVNIVDDVLTVGETSEVTFTFSEKVTGFDASDLVVVGGTLSNLSSTDGINWTATFTPTPGFTGTASVTVTAGSYTDLNGNLGTSGSDTAGVDTQGPSVVVNIVDDVLTVGETSEVTFTFSEKVTSFDASDLVVVGGTLSNLSSTDGINWTATFTPTPGFTGTASVTVPAGSYTDLNGNLGTSGSDTAGVDTQGPSVVVNIVDDVLTVGETSEVTFTFSEKVTGFDASDLVVVGGTLSNLSSTDGINWTATFTPTPGFTGTASVTVTAGSYTDLNGNLGTSGSDTAGVDTQGPSVVVNIVDDVLTVGETSEVTFTFSEKVTGFDASDLVVVGGTLSNLSSTDGINWTATFTPTPGFTGTASVTVTAGSYTDLNGNLGTSGSDTAGVDTQGPSVVVNIVDDVLTVGETSEVTFTFSEKVTGFDASDLVVVGGTLSNLSSTDGINWTATFTPTPGFTGTASVTVTAGSYTDLNGNLGTSGSDTAGVDTQGPSVVVNIVDDVLTVGETSEVTFTFSEKVTGFDASDLVVVGGTLSNLSSTDGINWTATFTPTPGFTGTASVTVTAGSYTDLNGNLGTSGSDTAGVDTQGPSVVVNIVDDVLTVGETSEVTFTFSEKVTGFDASDLVVVGGTLSNLSSTDGINWTATFTPTPGFTGTASVTVTAGSYTDLNGNLGTSGSDTAGVDTQGPSVVVNIVDDVLTVGETSEVTFTFSEKVTGFDASDLVVVGGTLSNLSSTDGINWTATFTPTPGFTGTASVTVTAGSYTDLNGNLGTSGVDTAGVDTSAPNTPTVLIVDDGNPGDGLLTAAEMGNDGVQLTVSINGTDFEAGGYVTLTIDGGAAIQLSFADFTDNGSGSLTFDNYTYANGVISWSETAPAIGQNITVTATQTDSNNNTSTQGSDSARVIGAQNTNVTVNEASLRGAVDATSKVTANVSFTAGNGALTSFQFGNIIDINGNINGVTIAGLIGIMTWEARDGGTVLIGKLNGIEVLQLSLSGSDIGAGQTGNVSVEVTLLDNLQHVANESGTNDEVINIDALISGIVIEAAGSNGVISNTISVTVTDDTLSLDALNSSGDNKNNTTINGVLQIGGADGNDNQDPDQYSASLTANITGWNGTDKTFADSGITAGGKYVYFFIDKDEPDLLIAYTISSGGAAAYDKYNTNHNVIFTLKLDPNDIDGDGYQYQLELQQAIDTLESFSVSALKGLGGMEEIFYIAQNSAGTTNVYRDITEVPNLSTILFSLRAEDNGQIARVNGNNNGFGVEDGVTVSGTEKLIVDYVQDVAGAKFTFTGAPTVLYEAYGSSGQLLGYGIISSGEAISDLGAISYVKLSAVGNTAFQLTGTTATTIVSSTTDMDLKFIVDVTDSDGDSSQDDFTVHLNASGSTASVITPVAFTSLAEAKSLTDVMDTDSDTLVFKAGDKNINNVSFSTDISNIHVEGIRQPMSWRIEGGVLIGSMPGRGDLLKLTLDWNGNAIAAGKEGFVVVEAELLGKLPHNIDYDSLSVSGIKVVATDSSGQTVKADVTVLVADSQHIAVDDTNNVDVLIDSFEVRGITAEWTGWIAESSDSDVRIYDSNDDDTAHDRIRWGNVESWEPRSGYNFDENTNIQVGDVGLNQNIVLGTFTHLNYPINGYSAITKATLEVTLMINGVPAKVTLEFNHNETGGNFGNNPPDIVTVANTSSVFVYDGARYTLQVMGFLDSHGNVVTSIETAENRSTSFPLVVKLIPGDGFELPTVNGNVLHNDIQGADGNMEIYGLSHNGSNASESHGTFVVQGTYGTLKLYSDGSYSYQVTTVGSLIPDNAVDTFNYTIEDSDGDLSTAELNINLNAVEVLPIMYEGAQGVDSFLLNNWGDKGQFATSLGGYETVASKTSVDIINLDTSLHIKAGASNDFVDLGISTANNIVETGSSLPNVSNQLSQQDVLTSKFMSDTAIVNRYDHLKQNVLNEVQPKSDTVNLGEGDDTVYGGEGTQMVYGGAGNDLLIGGAGIDGLRGGDGNDTLIGGLGDDVLRGDGGSDTFVWRYADADQGTDHIMDFNVREDKLDLSDLLQGETANTLESYLKFSLDNGSTVIDIDANKDGVFDQHIVLDGVNLFDQYSATDNAGVINGLLGSNGNGPLIIDAAPVTPEAPQGVTSLTDPHHNNGTIIP
ncbi:putative outer membrane adhesin like protein [Shewanella sp. MR-4]|nr:putative outer membrane adhesin like protein [Shewanella sp. MR-4]